MAAMPLTKLRRSGDDGSVSPFLFCWSDIFFIGALLFRWIAQNRGPSCSELANVPDISISRMEPKISPLRNSFRAPPLSSQRRSPANMSGVGLHMTDIVGSVHLTQESFWIIELESF